MQQTETEKEKVIYFEDLLQQDEFDLEDWRQAKRKYPVRTWFRSCCLNIQDIFRKIKWFFQRLIHSSIK